MPIDEHTITAKVETRNAADTIHRLACDEALNHTNEACLAFWKRILENVCAVLPPEFHPTRIVEHGPLAPMGDTESKFFGAQPMPFGTHQNKRVDEVPMDYMEWLDREPDFRKQLNRYLRSERILAEQGATDAD